MNGINTVTCSRLATILSDIIPIINNTILSLIYSDTLNVSLPQHIVSLSSFKSRVTLSASHILNLKPNPFGLI